MTKRLYIFFGGAGSGKTTIAKALADKLNGSFYDGDDSYTQQMRDDAKISRDSKDKVMLALYHELIFKVENLFTSSNIVCLTHSFTENKWKQMFIDKFGDIITFVYVKPNEEKRLEMILKRELNDPANIGRDENELKAKLEAGIKNADARREFPDKFVTIVNEYDDKSIVNTIYQLKNL